MTNVNFLLPFSGRRFSFKTLRGHIDTRVGRGKMTFATAKHVRQCQPISLFVNTGVGRNERTLLNVSVLVKSARCSVYTVVGQEGLTNGKG